MWDALPEGYLGSVYDKLGVKWTIRSGSHAESVSDYDSGICVTAGE